MKHLFFILMATSLIGCLETNDKAGDFYSIRNSKGVEAVFTPYGARLVSLHVPDKDGHLTSVVPGFDSVQQYASSTEPYFGATIGRYGNRIANGTFSIDSTVYQLSVNNGPNTLHGGKNGFQSKWWKVRPLSDSAIMFSYFSKDDEEGFPGNVTVQVIFLLTDAGELKINYEASTDKATVINLTNHAFFNLNGEGSGTIAGHILQINADGYTPIDSTLIPMGEIASVQDTPFDFREPVTIGSRINEHDDQLQYGKGYDHNYVLNGTGMREVAAVTGDKSGIIMKVFTEEPGLQFYSGNFMQGKNNLRSGPDQFRTAFCLETQHYPDSPNQPSFPTTLLLPGKTYHTTSVYQFLIAP